MPTKSQAEKGCKKLRGKGDPMKFIDFSFERRKPVGFRSGRRKQSKALHKLHVLKRNDDLWDGAGGLDSEV